MNTKDLLTNKTFKPDFDSIRKSKEYKEIINLGLGEVSTSRQLQNGTLLFDGKSMTSFGTRVFNKFKNGGYSAHVTGYVRSHYGRGAKARNHYFHPKRITKESDYLILLVEMKKRIDKDILNFNKTIEKLKEV